MKKSVLVLLIVFIVFSGFGWGVSAQTISGINASSIGHKDSVTVSGSGFGVKSPAAPLIWDDCESYSNGDDPVADGNWNRTAPGTVLSDVGEEFLTKYRSVPYRGTLGPHNRSSMYIAGGHDEKGCDDHTGRCVMIEKCASSQSKTWWTSWYVRLDSNWPLCDPSVYGDCAGQHNYKEWTAESTTGWYDTYHIYSGSQGCPDDASCDIDCATTDYMGASPNVRGQNIYSGGNKYCYSPSETDCAGFFDVTRYGADPGKKPSLRLGWVHQEVIIAKNSVGVFGERAYSDSPDYNGWTYYIDDVPDFNFNNVSWDIRSFLIGGFYRYCTCSGGGYHTHDDAFRYFDDIYMDNSLARVILANNQTCDNATIIEPQIPSAWSNNSITCNINLGALPDGGTAYLFVFNADNNHNEMGYPITLGEANYTTPTRSNGQPTGTLSSGTTSTNISLTTNVQAICKYSNVSGTNYTDMLYNFTGTNSTNHSTHVSGLENGQTYTYYIRCNSTEGYVNEDDFNITFSVGRHRADINDDDVINMPELIAFIARWKAGDGVNKEEVLGARDVWFAGGVYL